MMTSGQVAVLAGVSPRCIRKHAERGNITVMVISGLMLIENDEVERFLLKRKGVKHVKSIDSKATNGRPNRRRRKAD